LLRRAALLAGLVVLIAAPTASAGDGIRTFGTCNVFDPDPDRRCVQGNPWGAVLISQRERLGYRLCVRRPGGDRDCYRKNARPGKPSAVGFFGPTSPHTVGTYRFTWKADGRVLDKDRLRLRSEGV
jgi:hypothetical protein